MEAEIEIHDTSRGGAGVGCDSEGRIVFVPYTAPGDRVRVRIISTKKSYSQGQLLEVIRPSPERVTPRCAVFGKCGGCDWQHLPYEMQWKTKVSGALHSLKRAGITAEGIPLENFPAANPWNYRNRVQLRGFQNELGFRARGGDNRVPIERCEIAREEINQALPALRQEGMARHQEYKLEIDVSREGKLRTAWNAPHAALGFRQVNDEQNDVLRKWVVQEITTGRELLDLYGGSGNLSELLQDKMPRTHCVDVSAPREKTTDRYQFHSWPVAKWLERNFLKSIPGPRSCILDPPREGLGPDFAMIESKLTELDTDEIILIGCDEDAWARDCSRFKKKGWKLDKIALFDLFPQTRHLESVAKWVR